MYMHYNKCVAETDFNLQGIHNTLFLREWSEIEKYSRQTYRIWISEWVICQNA